MISWRIVLPPRRSTPRDKPERSDNNSMDTHNAWGKYRRAWKPGQFRNPPIRSEQTFALHAEPPIGMFL